MTSSLQLILTLFIVLAGPVSGQETSTIGERGALRGTNERSQAQERRKTQGFPSLGEAPDLGNIFEKVENAANSRSDNIVGSLVDTLSDGIPTPVKSPLAPTSTFGSGIANFGTEVGSGELFYLNVFAPIISGSPLLGVNLGSPSLFDNFLNDIVEYFAGP